MKITPTIRLSTQISDNLLFLLIKQITPNHVQTTTNFFDNIGINATYVNYIDQNVVKGIHVRLNTGHFDVSIKNAEKRKQFPRSTMKHSKRVRHKTIRIYLSV